MPHAVRFSIAPVRSLGLEHPDEIDLTEVGVVEDRRFFLADDTNRLVDRLIVGELVQIATHTDPGATRLRMTFPDGTVIDDEVRLGEPIETPIHGRTGVGHVVDGPWAAALSDVHRTAHPPRPLRPPGRDARRQPDEPHHRRLGRRARRRMPASGRSTRGGSGCSSSSATAAPHEEDTWMGRRIAIGDAILEVTKPDARCAITTQDPDTGVRDLDTLRTIIGYRGLREGKHADLGVLADVVQPGRVRLGDAVTVLD